MAPFGGSHVRGSHVHPSGQPIRRSHSVGVNLRGPPGAVTDGAADFISVGAFPSSLGLSIRSCGWNPMIDDESVSVVSDALLVAAGDGGDDDVVGGLPAVAGLVGERPGDGWGDVGVAPVEVCSVASADPVDPEGAGDSLSEVVCSDRAMSAARRGPGRRFSRLSARARMPAHALGLKKNLGWTLPSKTSDNEDAMASLGHSEVLSVEKSPARSAPGTGDHASARDSVWPNMALKTWFIAATVSVSCCPLDSS